MDAPQSLNGYSYADNTPITSSDPTGLCAEVDCPTRPGPGYENTTPGHVPGKPKKSSSTRYAEQGLGNDSGTAPTDSTGNTAAADYRCGFPGCSAGMLNYGPGVDNYVNNGLQYHDPVPDVNEWLAGRWSFFLKNLFADKCEEKYKCNVMPVPDGPPGMPGAPKPGPRTGLPAQGTISPKAVRFSQDSIKGAYKDGKSVNDTIGDLKAGRVTADDVPAIRIFERGGKIYTLDNRRLYTFQQAGVDIRFKRATAAEVENESWKFTTNNDGTSIIVRGER